MRVSPIRGVLRVMFASAATLAATLVVASPAQATLADCGNLYVIRVYFSMAEPRPQAVFAESPTATSGSYWQYPTTGLTDRAYQQPYATLLTAKTGKLRVAISTDGPGNCDIAASTHYLTAIEIMSGQ